MFLKAPTLTFLLLIFLNFHIFYGQDSNIQVYTPSKLMQSGQWDIKWFNNLYTEILSINDKK